MRNVMVDAVIEAGPGRVHWGYLGAGIPPVDTVSSGETVALTTVSGPPDVIAGSPYAAAPALLAIHERESKRTLPGHICTGPVAVDGAGPGDVLQVDIESIALDSNWGFSGVRPLAGALPHDFDERHVTYVEIDRIRNVGRLPWGMEVPLRPFFGVICVAPPPAWGELSTVPPRRNGGNLDNRELIAGATLFLPVFVDGALFSVGDGHGAQGDGEICSQAVEMNLSGRFRLTVRRNMTLTWPIAETPTHVITMAFDPDLDDCVVIAVRQMIDLLVAHSGLTRVQAYTLLSYVGDLRVTQVVNGNKGIHLMVPRAYFREGLRAA
jgi:acetamidase/formamidase